MKRILLFFISFFSLVSANAIPEVKVYSNGDYGLELMGLYQFDGNFNATFEESLFDDDGNFYFLSTEHGKVSLADGTNISSKRLLLKFNSEGEVVWAKPVANGITKRIAILDNHLFLPISNVKSEKYISYDDVKYPITSENRSYFLLKIDMESGDVTNYVEIERDNFVSGGFNPFESCDGFAFSPNGDLWFMFDINENYSRINKDYPVSFNRYGDNDKCLFVLSKDMEIKHVYCLGSDENDEVEEVNSDHLSPYMTFAGDTLYMYVPFLGKECNVSLDPENPVIVKNKSSYKKACAAFCKYLVKDDKVDLLAYNVISGNDGQVKRFAVNSQNKVVAAQPEKVWDGGDDYYYDILPDMTLSKLDGYAYLPLWLFEKKHKFWFDQNDDIIRMASSVNENVFSEGIVLPEPSFKVGMRAAKYDGKTLQNKWVICFDGTNDFPYCRVDAMRGMVYIVCATEADYDPSDSFCLTDANHVIARYIETYRIKTSSEHVSIVVNGGNDMVRHGSDAEVVISVEKGYHVESVKTSKGEDVEVSWNGHCSIKNVTEPVELIITTGLGENSVDQTDAVALSVYPNPVKDLLNVDDADDASFEIIDLSGNIVCSGVVNDGKIVTSELSEGVYVLTINKEIGAYSTKIVKK